MRRVLMGDVIAAARAMAAAPPARRGWVLDRICREATRAEAHRQLTGRMHPIWGDGSLMAAALRRPCRPEPGLEDDDYRLAMIEVLEAIRTTASGRSTLQGRSKTPGGCPRAIGSRDYPRAQPTQVGIAGSKASRPGAISSPQSVQ